MSGFIEWEFPCPSCNKLTAMLDVGRITENIHCSDCGYYSNKEMINDKWVTINKGYVKTGHKPFYKVNDKRTPFVDDDLPF